MDRGILFKPDLVRLLPTKSETRRLITPPLPSGAHSPEPYLGKPKWLWREVPRYTTLRSHRFGVAGDRLWVRETWTLRGDEVYFLADFDPPGPPDVKWKPGIHLAKADAKRWLRVGSVHPERLQDIDDAGARREGFANREDFLCRWDEINGGAPPAGAEFNPWVWVIRFELLRS